uniref:Peroxisomal membrane protein PEX16 n=1 Tax=Timema shepardi TaxID=629360 RepID=A0A7R9FXX8_TIMSH|nr:unnamed protein product [Timema shepardi]
MSSIVFSLPELYLSYKKWVSANPHTVSEVESIIKWVSYLIAGRINNSNIVSELVFSLSNILVLYNDRIIHKASHLGDVTFGDQLKIWLTVLEYSEVFIEISSRKLWGERSRWVIVVCLQIFNIQLHRGNLSQRQRLELSRRTIALLLYLLRSPFFDKYTKHHLLRLLNTLSKHVPLMGLVLTPLAQYLPMWQDTYFYMWST